VNLLIGLVAGLGMALLVAPATIMRVPLATIGHHLLCVALALVAGALGHLVLRMWALSALIALVAWWAPGQVRRMRHARRRRAELEAWPDALDSLVSALRAGMGLSAALLALGDTAPGPLRPVVASLLGDLEAEVPLLTAVERWRHSQGDPIVDRLAMTLAIAAGVGGRALPALLANLSTYLRAEARTRAELMARASWTVNAARLAAVAPWLMIVILGGHARDSYRTTTGGLILLAGACATGLGYLWMTSIARLPTEGRIFG